MARKNKALNGKSHKSTTKPADPLKELIPLSQGDAAKVKAFQDEIAAAKTQLADLQIQLTDAIARQTELVNLVKARSSEMMNLVTEIAVASGIDPTGTKDNKKWNLDTNSMTFQRIE